MSPHFTGRGVGLMILLASFSLGCGGHIDLGGGAPGRWFDADAVDGGATSGPTTLCRGIPNELSNVYTVDETTLYVGLNYGYGQGFDRVESAVWQACDLTSCASTVRTIHQQTNASAGPMVVSGTDVFFATTSYPDSWITICPIAGCSNQPRKIPTTQGVSMLGVDEGYVYWLGGYPSSMFRCTRAGCSVPESLSLESFPDMGMQPPVLADRYLYLLASLRVLRVRKDFSQNPEVVYESDLPLTGLAFADGYVYFAIDALAGEVRRCPLSGCGAEPEIVATAQRNPVWLSGDERSLYWQTTSELSPHYKQANLVGLPITGAANPTLFASNFIVAWSGPILINSHHLYWSDVTAIENGEMQIRTVPR